MTEGRYRYDNSVRCSSQACISGADLARYVSVLRCPFAGSTEMYDAVDRVVEEDGDSNVECDMLCLSCGWSWNTRLWCRFVDSVETL